FADVIDVMQASVGGRATTSGEKTFAQLRHLLENMQAFSESHPLMEPLVQRYQDYARFELSEDQLQEQLEKKLQIALGITISQIHSMYREQQAVPANNRRPLPRDMDQLDGDLLRKISERMNYEAEHEALKKLPGCGGGGKKSFILSLGGVREGESFSGSDSDYQFDHEGTCVVCDNGPKLLGPCEICIPCDAEMGGKGATLVDTQKDFDLAA
ncbi:MAG: hypothetical protein ACRD4B_08495, partial [Acidobacteriota bacterium]